MPPHCGTLAFPLEFDAVTKDGKTHDFAVFCPHATLLQPLRQGMKCKVEVEPDNLATLAEGTPDFLNHHVIRGLSCDGVDVYDHSFIGD